MRPAGERPGRPVAATVGCAEPAASARAAARAAPAGRTGPVSRAPAGVGVAEERTGALATLMISALEGRSSSPAPHSASAP
ncbi:hypothetical protein GCM10010421_61390 [Streptomyces glaucus]|uniref:Secreted protein n=1 Tax=Streptomyces glaucus TaxID=284029 RepID=A0ABN3KKA7_9ACTN